MLQHIPPRISLAHLPTPLRELKRLNTSLHNQRLWLKQDELTGLALSGNKVRKLEFLLADAISSGCDTVITCGGIQSNHCRATALACAQLGLRCELILRDDINADGQRSAGQGNHFLSLLSGADIELMSPEIYPQQLTRRFRERENALAQQGRKAYCIPTGGSNAMGLWGYVSAAAEILEQCEGQGFQPDLVVCASGSGGTQAGLTLGFSQLSPNTRVLGMAVCDSVQYFQRKVAEDIRSAAHYAKLNQEQLSELMQSMSIDVNDAYIGPGYALGYDELYQTIALLAREESVLLDPVYTGKAMHGLLTELRSGALAQYSNIVFVHTGGIFGLFPQSADVLKANQLSE